MLTPQEIQEKTFTKAVFGGYDMQTVDEFVEPLIQDYTALFNENAVLKNKLTVLVKKMEEFRAGEAARKQEAENMVAEAEEKCRKMIAEAEEAARQHNNDEKIAQEEHRLNCAKELASQFIDTLEKDIEGHLHLLQNLRALDLSKETVELLKAARAQAQVHTPNREDTRRIAGEIEENLSKLGISEDPEETAAKAEDVPASTSERPTIKFDNLQFGKNYNPVGQ